MATISHTTTNNYSEWNMLPEEKIIFIKSWNEKNWLKVWVSINHIIKIISLLFYWLIQFGDSLYFVIFTQYFIIRSNEINFPIQKMSCKGTLLFLWHFRLFTYVQLHNLIEKRRSIFKLKGLFSWSFCSLFFNVTFIS